MDIDVFADHRVVQGAREFRCALGTAGIVAEKREGDGATPAGRYPLRRVLYRADRVSPPETGLPTSALRPDDGWCDAPDDPHYNRPISLPYPASHERLWRDDTVYDIIVILGHNDDPPVPGRGSAIFLHIARTGYTGTEGCVALALDDLKTVLAACGPGDHLTVHAGGDG